MRIEPLPGHLRLIKAKLKPGTPLSGLRNWFRWFSQQQRLMGHSAPNGIHYSHIENTVTLSYPRSRRKPK